MYTYTLLYYEMEHKNIKCFEMEHKDIKCFEMERTNHCIGKKLMYFTLKKIYE